MKAKIWLLALAAWAMGCAVAAEPKIPKVAVTDLTYEEKVSEYFQYYASQERSSAASSRRSREREGVEGDYSASESGRYRQDYESSTVAASGYLTRIDRGELRKFTADVKGEMLKSGVFRLVQGKPYTEDRPSQKIFDIIERIKKGYYPGADYVLFGTVNAVDWRDESMPLKGTDTETATLALELVVDFSLINTRTYEVMASFSASGSGQDARIVQPGMRVKLSRPKVMQEVSKSLGVDAARQLEAQFEGAVLPSGGRQGYGSSTESRQEEVIIFK